MLGALLSACVVGIITNFIKSNALGTKLVRYSAMGEQALDFMTKELSLALPSTINIQKSPKGQTLTFRKILYKGIMISEQTSTIFPPSLIESEEGIIYFPSILKERTNFYTVKLTNEHHQGKIKIDNALTRLNFTPNLLFYVVSEPIQYECAKQPKTLFRKSLSQPQSLLAHYIQNCEFSFEKPTENLLISLELGDKITPSVHLVAPILLREF